MSNLQSVERLTGLVVARLYRDGRFHAEFQAENLITEIGDQMYGENGGGVGSPPAVPTGMRLGTGNTAAAKTGAGAAIVTYITGSSKALDSTPTSALNGSSRRISYVTTWNAGEATDAAIAEVVLTNIAITDVAGAAANTISRVVFGATIDKQANDSLTVTWRHDLLGA